MIDNTLLNKAINKAIQLQIIPNPASLSKEEQEFYKNKMKKLLEYIIN